MLRNARKTNLFLPFLLLLIVFGACQSSNNTAAKEETIIDVNKLLGKWQSTNNPKSVIELTPNRMFSFYDGLKLADESLMIYHKCVSRCVPEGMAQMPCLVTDGKRAENCFKVLELTEKRLSYALIGEEDKVLSFQKL